MDDHAAAAAHGWQVAQQIVREGEYDLVVLDEILGAVKAGLVPLDELLALVRAKPATLHLVLTGRNAPAELIEARRPGLRDPADQTPPPTRHQSPARHRVLATSG